MYNILTKTVLSDTFIDFLFLTIHVARHKQNDYQLLINKLYCLHIAIGNDLETSLCF